MYAIVYVFILVLLIVLFIAFYAIHQEKKKEREEEERKRNTKCCICNKCSMGDIICEDCYQRAKTIKNEIPKDFSKNYLSTTNFYQNSINNILDAKTQTQKEYYGSLLIIATDILKTKYFVSDIWKKTYLFLQELQNEGDSISNDFRNKYYSPYEDNDNEKNKASTIKDNSNFTAPYRCKDGHQVRSKAEREIDNFLFENQISHIYEQKYEHPITKEWALPDFYLPNYNLYIEYFGLTTPEYLFKREQKIKMYQSDRNIRFEYLTQANDENIFEKLEDICRKYNIPIK